MSRVPVEKVKEIIRGACEQAAGDNSIITVSSLGSFADDSSIHVSGHEVSGDTDVFDSSGVGEGDQSLVTGSISDDKDATVFKFGKTQAKKAKEALNVSGKRFERQTGAKGGRNFEIEFQPVS